MQLWTRGSRATAMGTHLAAGRGLSERDVLGVIWRLATLVCTLVKAYRNVHLKHVSSACHLKAQILLN